MDSSCSWHEKARFPQPYKFRRRVAIRYLRLLHHRQALGDHHCLTILEISKSTHGQWAKTLKMDVAEGAGVGKH